MDPIPETAESIEEYGPFFAGGDDVLAELKTIGRRVRQLVPECVGMSLAILEDGVTFTFIASDADIAALDGVQYLNDGPCVSAVGEDRRVEYRADQPLDEQSWQLFSQVSAAAGIASTLTLPIIADEQVMGSVNLYASSTDAFAGKHDVLATLLGAWAPGAVTNADLGFSTRRSAEQAPQILRNDMHIQVAVGIIVVSESIDPDAARERLREAAQRAGVSESALAEKVIGTLGMPDDSTPTRPDES